MELLPEISAADKKTTRELLDKYNEIRCLVQVFERKNDAFTDEEQQQFVILQKQANGLEIGIEMISDDEVKKIIEHRFIKSRSNKLTLLTYGAIFSTATIHRRINTGIEVVAKYLKFSNLI
ncbi:hypothetical protein BSK66_25930 [Paenibacillus odorifer]|uniref:Uncharacterized protein n=1 Tax=Paenibacillus odorifer TaxID=189426 RepID=A0A1R0X1D5_9BACL|nr:MULTISPECIES: hypothetical protein [Paenibacillus]ETT61875.1 hypothetical protein C171_11536 [Paenibacillus sp. FSL H8-237]OMD26541.1 hypothetical protein BJP51_26785 [Paenibacillus odorifer]OME49960.1 hypothetical protein BSK66_25930 [Paenibacillus odorifer]